MKRTDYDGDTNRVEWPGAGCTVLTVHPYPGEYSQEIHLVKPDTRTYLVQEQVEEKLQMHVVGIATHTAFNEPCWLTREDAQQLISVLQEHLEGLKYVDKT